jgi:tetratricopeptide (TPR) repeat protein
MLFAKINNIKTRPLYIRVPIYLRLALAAALALLTADGQARWIDAYRAGRYTEALSISETELKQQPKDPKLWTQRALALQALGRNKESLNSFESALRFQPAFVPALEGATELAYKTRDPRASKFVGELLKSDPKNATAHAMAGVLAFEKRDFRSAADHFEQAGPTLASNEEAYSLYGASLLVLGNPQKALPIFAALLEKYPQNGNVRYNLAYAQLLNGNSGDAISTLHPLTTSPTPDPSALNLMASAKAANGQLAEALEDLRTAARLKPGAEENYLDFATLCLEHNSPDIAQEIINIGLQNVGNSARLYSMRGIINAQKGNYDQSASDFEQANRLSPDKSYGSVGLSMVYAESKRPEEAQQLLRERLKAAPNDPTLNYLLADVLVNQPNAPSQANLAEARIALLRSLATRPGFSNAHALLGKIYRRSGENAKAIAELKLALSNDPENRVALNQIVSLLRDAGKQQEAAVYSASLRRLLKKELTADVDQSRVRIVRVP